MCNSCHLQTNIEIFHCSHYGLTTLPGYIHENTIELNLSYNLIEILHEDSFTRLHNIQKLILAHNKIYKITERAFLPIMNSLIWLDLRFNQLISNYHNPFPVLAFSQLVYVSYLDLSGNELNYLPARFLYGMGMSLKRLEMSLLSNKIYTEPDTFDGLNRLHHLNLAYNIFANLMEDALNGLRPEHFSYLNLEGVKWTCDCHILWFRQWLNRLPKKALYINSKPGGECVSPSQYQHMALMYLNLTSLQCEPELMHTIPSHHDDKNDKNSVKRNLTDRVTTPIHVYGIEGENLTLVCSFISEPKMYIQWFYNGILIQPHWSHVIQTISPGIKFTTTLFFKQLDKTTDEGYYKCQASNYKGQASATFYVHVQKPIEQRTPSPQSSDMGYLTSNASQNCESLIDLNPNHNEYNSSIKQLKPRVYYTLGVRSGNHSPELIYSLNNTNEKHHLTCSIDQDYSISDNSLSPKQMSCSPESYSFHQHSDKHQYGSQNTNVYHDKTFNQTSCPIHGLINKNENDFNPAYLIQNQNNSDCPIHGSKSFTNLGKSFYKNEYKLNKSKQYPNKSLSLNLNYSNRTFLESIKMNSLDETCDDIKNLQQHHRINCT
ncbi:putative slit [Schistosoma mansoni]|uniref:putative slit n=1 Tax=Schistosoma mansoni TaxID=6183 RepID=UPI0001A637C3|nr:putative slit [Schistosoma mansoni]|eukprot:XP_018652020.1 putative slit [Schistosoma mansoni]